MALYYDDTSLSLVAYWLLCINAVEFHIEMIVACLMKSRSYLECSQELFCLHESADVSATAYQGHPLDSTFALNLIGENLPYT